MQLTPRTLVMAVGACLAGGLVLGVAGAVGSGVAASAAQTEPSPPTTSPKEDLGDSEVTFPSPSQTHAAATPIATAIPTQVPTPTPKASLAPAESTPSPTAPPTPPGPLSRAESMTPVQQPRPEPTKMSESPRPRALRAPARPEAAPRKVQSPRGSWQPPTLGIGVVNIGAPRLASGARPAVAVLCIPSTSCSAQGSSLTITAEADTVVVTWTAPASREWRAWHADSDYSPASGG